MYAFSFFSENQRQIHIYALSKVLIYFKNETSKQRQKKTSDTAQVSPFQMFFLTFFHLKTNQNYRHTLALSKTSDEKKYSETCIPIPNVFFQRSFIWIKNQNYCHFWHYLSKTISFQTMTKKKTF